MCDIDPAWLAAQLHTPGSALVGVDVQGRTVVWSAGARELFGWRDDEVIGRAVPFIPTPLQQEWQLQLQRVLESGEPTPVAETQRLTRDGRSICVVRACVPVRGSAGQVIGVLDTLMDITALKQIDDESRALAQVRERELIAMDLHDGLIQSLYATVLSLSAQERTLEPSDSRTVQALRASRAEIERVIEETRTYLLNLRAREFTPRNLESGLRLLADGLRLNANMDVRLEFDPKVEAVLQPEMRGHLLYLVREAVSNVLRHAQASQVSIELTRSDGAVRLRVEDDGRGFTDGGVPRRHQGLRNMAERARLMGGRLDVVSKPGEGTRISLELPA